MDKEKEQLFHLYTEYMLELWAFTGDRSEEMLKGWFNELYETEDIEFFQIKLDEIPEPVGFLVIKNLDEKHRQATGSDKYICEAYIRPEYRNHGIMTKIINDRYIKNGISISMHILKENRRAKIFWTDIFMKSSYTYEHVEKKDKETSNGKDCEFVRFVKVS